MWNNRPYKSLMRHLAVEGMERPAKTALFVPAAECLCVKEALSSKAITKDTFVLAVEHKWEIAKKIEKVLPTLVNDNSVYTAPLHNVSLVALHNRTLDLAFFDLCGQMTRHIALWLYWLSGQEFNPGAKVSFTFNLNARNNQLLHNIDNMYLGDSKNELYSAVYKCPMVTLNPFAASRRAERLPDAVFCTLYALYGALRKNYIFKFDCIHQYRDSITPMLFVSLTIVQRAFNSNQVTNRVLEAIPAKTFVVGNDKSVQSQPLVVEEQPDWQSLQCPNNFTAAQKAAVVRQAKKGIRPEWMKPQVWAWHILNPNGIRRAVA